MSTSRSKATFTHEAPIPGPVTGIEAGSLDVTVNRRQLIAIAGLAGAGLALSGAASAIPNVTGETARLSALTISSLGYEHFLELIGESFVVRDRLADGSTRQADLVLSDVMTIVPTGAPRTGELRAQPFSLLFTLDSGALSQSGIMQFQHPELGRLDLFVHQVGMSNDTGEVIYEAVFN